MKKLNAEIVKKWDRQYFRITIFRPSVASLIWCNVNDRILSFLRKRWIIQRVTTKIYIIKRHQSLGHCIILMILYTTLQEFSNPNKYFIISTIWTYNLPIKGISFEIGFLMKIVRIQSINVNPDCLMTWNQYFFQFIVRDNSISYNV